MPRNPPLRPLSLFLIPRTATPTMAHHEDPLALFCILGGGASLSAMH
jgi:hypothetical protein